MGYCYVIVLYVWCCAGIYVAVMWNLQLGPLLLLRHVGLSFCCYICVVTVTTTRLLRSITPVSPRFCYRFLEIDHTPLLLHDADVSPLDRTFV
jgi:hypothetical protein